MGSKSKKHNTAKPTQQQMDHLAKGKVSNDEVMRMYGAMQNSQLGQMLPVFGAMLGMGNQSMTGHPMFSMMRDAGFDTPEMPQVPQILQQAPQQPQQQQAAPMMQPGPYRVPGRAFMGGPMRRGRF